MPTSTNQAWYVANPDFGFNGQTSQASISKPAQFILVGDAGRSDGTASRGGMYPQPWAFDVATQARFVPRHNDGGNIGYADGHVKWAKPAATWTDYNNNQWRRTPS